MMDKNIRFLSTVEAIPFKNFKEQIRIVKEEQEKGNEVTIGSGVVITLQVKPFDIDSGFTM